MNASFFFFIGAKGGSGTTTICTEVARALRERRSVAVVDGDLTGRRNVGLAFDALAKLDAARTKSGTAIARVDGLTVTELAPSLSAAFAVSADEVEHVAVTLDGHDRVLVDAPQPFAAAVRPFAVRASLFLIVLEPTLFGIAGARVLLGDLQSFGVPPSRVALVLNDRGHDDVATRAEIEQTLGVRVLVEIPPRSERGFERAVGTLAKLVDAVAPEPPLEGLNLSARLPVGDRRTRRRAPQASPNGASGPQISAAETQSQDQFTTRESIKQRIHEALSERIDLVAASRARGDAAKIAQLRERVEAITLELLAEHPEVGSAEEVGRLKQEIVNETLGLGPLEDLMADPDVTEIMVNGHGTIYVERFGMLELTSKRFASEQQLRVVIERIVAPLGRRIDESSPMVDARLPDGSRVNAIIEPVALDGAMLTIRRFGPRRLQAADLVKLGAVTEPVLNLLRAAIRARLNIVISGGTGSGKTTFLNILSSYLPERERIITIEDAAELALAQPHVGRLESRPPNIEGRGEIRIRDLVRNSLRMRPDRIIVGEVRGAEALDMLQAMNTGHDGSLTTVHANSARDALARIETMVLMAGLDLPMRAIREQVASAVNLVIHTARLRDGSRKVVGVSEVVGMEGDIVTMQEIVRFQQHGIDAENKVLGEFQFSGVQPVCLRRFAELGIPYDVRELSSLAPAGASW